MVNINASKIIFESRFLRIKFCDKYNILSITWLSGINQMNNNQLKKELLELVKIANNCNYDRIFINESNFSYLPKLDIKLCFYQFYKERLSHLKKTVGILKHSDDYHSFNVCHSICEVETQNSTFQYFDSTEEAMGWITHSQLAFECI
ncbi:hypothetical protein [Chondrinema litorale]|uniref:hypothetical protein n=1 Tax=Chondrinema litorale TaxID=2994555 RepID=UPI002543A628|nr:hypothetical protein [Chondrinema litorale]UZR97200.1 hypothetical protein OQ292_25205 [Chondrinema litorale]